MNEITYKTGGLELIDEIEPLWEMLNALHLEKSPDFKHHYRAFTFESRRKPLESHGEIGNLYIILAVFEGHNCGYCVASFDTHFHCGEIDSLFILPAHRGKHIGDQLMRRALTWIEGKGAEKIIINVASGNEQAFGFYEKFGFKPRLTQLQLIEK